ncbi:HHR016Cp [Eremothecium sinecaudum]|uniref:HHR016Cp n=1 Tax=Eremothecium sinecaudum TaxID=45286 RepID=A0A109V0D7_9SACH|nr:HHR016Cp [Eremothecium sinecaudum]AMD22785.1 HHR016Cp [Eremothecium sinecaudum]
MNSSLGTPKKVFETPVRPISTRQFESLREKVCKDSPGLYKARLLTDPTMTKFISRSVGATPSSVFDRKEAKNNMPKLAGERGLCYEQKEVYSRGAVDEIQTQQENLPNKKSSGITADKELQTIGSYENPILEVFTRRVVNKELEIKKIIVNIASLFVWNLCYKFLVFFLYYTKKGNYLCKRINQVFLAHIVFKIYPHLDLDSGWLKIWRLSNVSRLVHIVFFINVLTSLYMLLVKSQNFKVSDLGLNERQKQLLGVTDKDSRETLLPEGLLYKSNPRLNFSSENKKVDSSKDVTEHSAPTQPFLFKSLQTPLKASEISKGQQQQKKILESSSAFVNKINAYDDLRKSVLMSRSAITPPPVNNIVSSPSIRPTSGYIPSSKYAYMMDSPSPRKRL